MKLFKSIPLLATTLFLSGCLSNSPVGEFRPSSLPNSLYNSYWAMLPNQGVYNTVKFNRDGSATLYRFTCVSATEYYPKEHETYQMSSIPQGVRLHFTGILNGELNVLQQLAASNFTTDIRFNKFIKDSNFAQMTQTVLNKKISILYAPLSSPKPLCSSPKLEKKAKEKTRKLNLNSL